MHPIKGDAETCVSFLGADFVVYYDFTITNKGCPAVMYQPNGDPGWPAEAVEFYVTATAIRQDVGSNAPRTYLDLPNWLAELIDLTIHDSDDVRERIGRQLDDADDK